MKKKAGPSRAGLSSFCAGLLDYFFLAGALARTRMAWPG